MKTYSDSNLRLDEQLVAVIRPLRLTERKQSSLSPESTRLAEKASLLLLHTYGVYVFQSPVTVRRLHR